MGLYKNCYTVNGASIEIATFALYDEAASRVVTPSPGNQGFNDVLGEPYLEDNDDDGLGERVRPEVEVEVRCKAEWSKSEEQRQDQTGNDPASRLKLTLVESELKALGLLVNGVFGIRVNDRLLRLANSESGEIRFDFTANGREGLYVYEVRPGATGEGKVTVMLEDRTNRF